MQEKTDTLLARRVPVRRRPPVQRERVVGGIRGEILSGRLVPGGRLPSQKDLMEHFRVDSQTVSSAMQVLCEDGFIETRPRAGRFVAQHPPHLAHYALTFPFSQELAHSQFYRALRDEAVRMTSPETRFSIFYDIEARHDLPDYHHLRGLIERHALAGVIYAGRPWGLWNDPVLTEPGVPRVDIAQHPHEAGVAAVCPDDADFRRRAIERLAAGKHRRVAVLELMSPSRAAETTMRQTQALLASKGLETCPRWLQAAAPGGGQWTSRQVAAMLYGPAHDRPDALLITDDNLVPEATAGVVMAGRRAGRDLLVLAHANFPHVTPSAVPAERLGFDVSVVLAAALERLRQIRQGEAPSLTTSIPARWEGEAGVGAGERLQTADRRLQTSSRMGRGYHEGHEASTMGRGNYERHERHETSMMGGGKTEEGRLPA